MPMPMGSPIGACGTMDSMSDQEPAIAGDRRFRPLPSGDYYGIVGNLRPDKGGLTSAMLQRFRLFNERLAATPGTGRMRLLTFSQRDKDDVESHGLTDGVDVLNLERHGNRVKSSDAWIDWLEDLGAAATDENPVYFICDGHEVGAVVAHALKPLPNVYFIQVIHNPTTSAKYDGFRQAAQFADAIVCATKRQAQAIRTDKRHGGTACGAVPVYDVSYPRRTGGAAPAERSERRIVMLTRVHWQKDIQLAVESFHHLRLLADEAGLTKQGELALDIYGALESRGEVARATAAIDRHGLQSTVTLHGYDRAAFDQLSACSITWLTSRFEGWGLAITEAQQSGCIPIVVDEPFGPREQIEHGKDGFLVRSRTAQWLRHQLDNKSQGPFARATRRVGHHIITPLSEHVARETLRVLQLNSGELDLVRTAALERANGAQRSPETYVDNWVRVIEMVRAQSASRV
jgi:glycosyltransferase involved in cell wall biosynthesis